MNVILHAPLRMMNEKIVEHRLTSTLRHNYDRFFKPMTPQLEGTDHLPLRLHLGHKPVSILSADQANCSKLV